MLNQNAIIIIDVNGNVLREPIGSFRANSNYTSSITVIAPFELDSVVSANYSKKNRKNDDIAQFLIPNGNKKGKDIIGENDPLYQLIYNWHVFEADVDQLAVAYFAKYRSDMLFVSIGVGNIVKPAKATTYKGEFGIDSLLPEVADNGDYYISKNYNFMDKNIPWTLNDYAYYDNGWKKSNYKGEAFTEPIELLVDPAIEANYEIQEDLDLSILLAGRLAILESKVNVISDQVDNQQLELDNHDTRIETLETKEVALKGRVETLETNVQTNTNDINDLDTRVESIEGIIDGVMLEVKIDNDTITRNSSSEMQVNPLLVEQINDNTTNLIGVVNDVIYQGSTHIMTFKRNEMPDIVIDLPIEALISNVSLDGDDLVFTFENGDVVRVPLNTLLVGVVKQVNGVYADSNGIVNLTIDDIPTLRAILNGKLDITTFNTELSQVFGGKNLARPYLEGKEYLGNGVYRVFDGYGLTLDYNVYNGVFTLNGETTQGWPEYFAFDLPNEQMYLKMYHISGSSSKSSYPSAIVRFTNKPQIIISLQEMINGYYIDLDVESINFISTKNVNYTNYQFKIQVEKGDTATPYTLPAPFVLPHELTSGEWITPTLLNGWTNVASNELQYRKDINGNVQLRGHLNDGTLETVIATLPAGFRPLKTTYFICSTDLTIGSGTIGTNGNITLIQGDLTNVRLDTISFSTL